MGKEVIALDIGGTNLRAGIVNGRKIIEIIRKKTPNDSKSILSEICDSISILKAKSSAKGIGIAIPGPLFNGKLLNPPNLALNNFNIRKYIQDRFKLKTEVENDAKCAALGESVYGVKKKNFIMLTLGTGIGGGVIIDGKLYDKGRYGTEFGEIYLSKEKTFEQMAGRRALWSMSEEKFGRKMDVSELISENTSGAISILDKLSEALGQGIGSLINAFDPEIVVLAGGVRNAGQKYLDMIRKHAKNYIKLPKKVDIVWSKLEEPGLLGAGLLIE